MSKFVKIKPFIAELETTCGRAKIAFEATQEPVFHGTRSASGMKFAPDDPMMLSLPGATPMYGYPQMSVSVVEGDSKKVMGTLNLSSEREIQTGLRSILTDIEEKTGFSVDRQRVSGEVVDGAVGVAQQFGFATGRGSASAKG